MKTKLDAGFFAVSMFKQSYSLWEDMGLKMKSQAKLYLYTLIPNVGDKLVFKLSPVFFLDGKLADIKYIERRTKNETHIVTDIKDVRLDNLKPVELFELVEGTRIFAILGHCRVESGNKNNIVPEQAVYQRIDDPVRGDCWKCVVCTLLNLDYDKVPNFVEHENYYEMVQKTFEENGYEIEGMLYNPNVLYLENPTSNVYKDEKQAEDCLLDSITDDMGINGLFMATVYSPKYTDAYEHPNRHLHCVICDKNFNIVFDPQKKYKDVVNYPYSKLIGYNGIRSIDIIRKKNK